MFCSKCGNQMNDGDKFCEKCGAAVELVEENVVAEETNLNENAVETPVVEEPSVNIEATPSAETSAEEIKKESKPKKTSKKKKTIIGIIAAVLAAVAVCSVFLWEYIENTAVKTFSSPTSYYHYVESKNISAVSKSAGRFVKMMMSGTEGSVGTESEFKIQLGDILLEKIATETGVKKENITWLSEAGVKMDTSVSGNLTAASGNITVNGEAILGMELVFDYETYCFYLRCPQFNEQYALIDLSALNNVNVQMPEFYIDWENMPGAEKVEEIVERYLTIAIESFDNVSENSDVITANGVSQSCTRLTIRINENSLKKCLKAVLKEVRNDKDIEEIIKNVAEMCGETDVDKTYTVFIESVKAAIENIDEAPINEFEFKIINWVDGKGDIVGREIDFGDMLGNPDFTLRYATAHDGTDVGIEAVIGTPDACFKVLGEGEISGTKMNGNLNVIFNDKEYVKVNIKNYDIDLIEDNYINGTFTITLSKEACDMIVDEMGLTSKDAESLSKCAFRIDVESSEESGFISASILYDEKLVIGVSTSAKQTKGGKVKVPENFVELKNSNDVENYFSSFDAEKIKQALIKAGMPESLTDSLGEMGNGALGGFDDYPDDNFRDDYLDNNFGFDDDVNFEDEFDFDFGNDDDFLTDNPDGLDNNMFQNGGADSFLEFDDNFR